MAAQSEAQPAGGAICKLEGCGRPCYYNRLADKTHDYCGRSHAKAAGACDRPLRINASQNALENVGGKLCRLPGCLKGVCIEGDRIHDFCCRTHASRAAELEGPQMRPGFTLKDHEAIKLIGKKHDEKQRHNLPAFVFETDVYSGDPWALPEISAAGREVEDWYYWHRIVEPEKRDTGENHRWKAASGKPTIIKEGGIELGAKHALVLVQKRKDGKHQLVFSEGLTRATRVRWKMLEYRANDFQKWSLICISRSEEAAPGSLSQEGASVQEQSLATTEEDQMEEDLPALPLIGHESNAGQGLPMPDLSASVEEVTGLFEEPAAGSAG